MSDTAGVTERQALALAVTALDYVAAESPDVRTWLAAAALLRAMLAELRGPCERWTWFRPGKGQGRRNGRKSEESEVAMAAGAEREL